MKQSELKPALAKALANNREAQREIALLVTDLRQEIVDLKAAASDPEVTDQEFLTQVNDLVVSAQELAQVVPDVVPELPPPSPPEPEAGTPPVA